MYYTTLEKIRAHQPCYNGWKKLLAHLDKTEADDEPLALATILDANGFDDALWCLRTVDGIDGEARLYAVWCARQVQHLMTDPRSIAALDVADRYARGQATDEELAKARVEAWDAASAEDWEEAWAACVAAWVATSTEAWVADRVAASASVKEAQAAEFRRRFCTGDE